MHRFFATILKEIQLLIRDKTGLALLFAMPVVLVFIMTLIQHEAYKSLNESGIPVLLVNKDIDSLGLTIEREFANFPLSDITIDHGKLYTSDEEIREAVLSGEFVVAIIIPKGATEELRKDVTKIISVVLDEDATELGELEQIEIDIIADPVASKSFVMAITSGLREFIASVRTQVLFRIMADEMQAMIGSNKKAAFPQTDFFTFNESYASEERGSLYQPNAIQHNVPAWSIFAIFFIVIPLAHSVISERSEGLYTRLRTFPGTYLTILSGKLFLYFLLAIIQFILIVLVGKYGLVLLGMPELSLGNEWFSLIILTVAVCLTAVGYGFFIGTLFDTPAQSSIFGGMSILFFSALGGIWVPVNIMPSFMQDISAFSPLNWALNGYYEIFIKGGDWAAVQWQVLKLTIFFGACLGVAYWLYQLKKRFS